MNNKIIILDDGNKYTLIKSIMFQNKKYIYLADINDVKNIIIGELKNDKIMVVEDSKLFGELILKFAQAE